LCQRRGALDEANELLGRALEFDPQAPLAWFNRGVVLALQGDSAAAVASCRRCLELEPGQAQAAFSLGLLLYGQGELAAAEQALRTALALNPHDPETHSNLAGVLLEQDQIPEAIACCRTALALQPDHAGAHSNLGAAQLLQGDYAVAIRSCREAIRLQPEAAAARDTLANALLELGEHDEALSQFQQALALQPEFAQGHYNLGTAQLRLRQPGRAIASYEAALRIRPAYPEARWNLALSLLLSGDYGRGWELFDAPACLEALPVRRPHATPRCPHWDGEPLGPGEPLLLVSEQGLGDTLQFVRYVPLLAARGLGLRLCTEEKLHGLLAASGIGVPLLSPAEGNAVADGHWLRLLGVTPATPLATAPYLRSSEALIRRWREVLAPETRPILGVHWQGNPAVEMGGLRGRSLALEQLAPLAATGVGSLLSLQRGSGCEQLEHCSFRQRFVQAQERLSAVVEFLELAAILEQCDLVITTDTAMAHLAGAIGRPTWLLLHHQSEWRWGLDGSSTPWYPSLRLFRQGTPGDWSGVIEAVAAELPGWAAVNGVGDHQDVVFSLEEQPTTRLACSEAHGQLTSESRTLRRSDPMTRRLHIGGTVAREGWEILNALTEPWVDHVGQAEDLSRFEDNTFVEVYASYVLEQLGYQSALPAALREWHRVLAPEGRLMVSVPDLDTLCELYTLRDSLASEDRFKIMVMMFGAQVDQYDFHCVRLNQELLTSYLSGAGFSEIKRVNDFGLFADCSTLFFAGRPISLNLEARKRSADSAGPSPQATATAAAVAGSPAPAAPASPAAPAGDPLQASAGWGGGYYTGLTYGCYCFPELAPNWLDFALLSQRQRPPRSGGEGSRFRYLELGSGMGLGLCLLAAAYPEGSFIGIDFHPSHIAHSQWLAAELGLANVSFHEADFLELAPAGAPLPFEIGAGFHYAVAHGILSWIGPAVRAALLQLAGRLLRPGGAFYCSYNTYPGWLDRSAFKALADLERQRLGSANLPLALQRAGSSLERLLQSASPLADSFPRLSGHVQKLKGIRDIHYLCGEFPEHWQPFYVGQVHQLAAAHKLSYASPY
ncbi:MAG: tetratricopeptide repeat protein, partial [Cyanobium sp.]